MLLHNLPHAVLQFYLTASYTCNYMPGRMARSQVATPGFLVDAAAYSDLVQRGFRRSGTFAYRPYCDACRACVPVRVPVESFTADRAQRRAWRRHDNLEVSLHGLEDNAEYFELYRRYQLARHFEEGAAQDSRAQYRNFLLQSQVDSMLAVFREAGVLRMVSLIDVLRDGCSSVYTFYDPAVAGASYGTYGVLWQIELCRKLGLPYLYLGYWIEQSRKMAYKARFRPLQALQQGVWRPLSLEA
jgi:arginine-tRNA-protein transferase